MLHMDDRCEILKQHFVEKHGFWDQSWEALLSLSPDFFEAYLEFSLVAWQTGAIEPKVREFIYIAVNAATTHLYEPALRHHVRNALKHGATRDELIEVLQMASVLGIHTCTEGVPVLIEEINRSGGGELDQLAQDPKRQALKEKFIRDRGFWGGFWDDVLKLSPAFFEAYLKFSSVPWKAGKIPPKVKEFIYIAIDSATTHLYVSGLRIHIQNAFKHGATKEEIMEVLELVSVIGIQACTMGIPILIDELSKAGQPVGAVP